MFLSGYLACVVLLAVQAVASSNPSQAGLRRDPSRSLSDFVEEEASVLFARNKRADDTNAWEAVTSAQAQEITSLKAQLTAMEAKMTSLQTQQGSTYIRWGRSQCPNGVETVYAGFAGGSKYSETGGGSNRLCMSPNPQFDNVTPYNGNFANIHGVEWYVPGHDHTDAPCALCRVPHTTSAMIPGTNTCPTGWALQYAGHISAVKVDYVAAAEFLCVDENPEDRVGTGAALIDGGFFMYSIASCGSLPCPPYAEGKVVTCVVCSK